MRHLQHWIRHTELAIISTIAQEDREMDYQEASRYPISGLPSMSQSGAVYRFQ